MQLHITIPAVEIRLLLRMGHINIRIVFFLLEVSNDAYATLGQFWLAVQHWFISEISEKATLNINLPYLCQQSTTNDIYRK